MYKKVFFLLLAAAAGIFPVAAEEQKTRQAEKFIRHCVECSAPNPLDPNMEGSMFNWMFEGKYKVVYTDSNLFSYYIEELSYTGGAHGSFTVTAGSMYRVSGRKITLKDIAPDADRQKKLLDLITLYTAQKFKCSVKELPKRLLNMPELTENFYFNGQGITFVYNEYEIAGKGASPVKIFIPFKQFKVPAK